MIPTPYAHAPANAQQSVGPVETPPPIAFFTPSELTAYEPPEGGCLVGHNHITKGATAVIAGAAGIGKSRVAVALAVAGARGVDWMGLTVHRRFRSLIIQSENGPLRLRDEFSAIGTNDLDGHIRVSPPPPFGFEFGNAHFVAAIKATLADFQPDVVILDPWTATVTDDKGKDYRETLQLLKRVFGCGDESPALVIVAHTRKPGNGDRVPRGRSLMHEVAGSYVLTSHARCVFNMLPASDDTSDDRVVFENSKNNDGKQVKPSAWHRQNGLFLPCPDFDWNAYNGKQERGRSKIGRGDLREVFEQAGGSMTRQEAAKALMASVGCSKSVAYDALKNDGPFAEYLAAEGAMIRWSEPETEVSESDHA
ncbi:MAG TPA: AAA family ATPase [Opitutaceae bacterium]|nr:AAA family ATPase [Opitutaceae bacterium]